MKTFIVQVWTIDGNLIDKMFIDAKTVTTAKKKGENAVEAHLDFYGNDCCNDGIYPERYKLTAREVIAGLDY